MHKERDYIGSTLLTLLLITIFAFSSCIKSEKPTKSRNIKHTIVVYLAADNNLYSYVDGNLYDIRRAMNPKLSLSTNVVVFVDRFDKRQPALLSIHDNKIDTLKVYNSEINSVDVREMSNILREIATEYGSETMGLVLWSHGNSWINWEMLNYVAPSMYRVAERPSYAFGYDERHREWMDIDSLKSAIPEDMFEYIIFDACYMGSIEVAYALKDRCDWLISSAVEIMGYGFPYISTITSLSDKDYSAVCDGYYRYYNSKSGESRTATISLVDCTELDSLANCFKKIVAKYGGMIKEIDISQLQRLDRFDRGVAFDMVDYIEHLIPQSDTLLLQEFCKQFYRAVPQCQATEQWLGEYDINTFCGLSIYVPTAKNIGVLPYYRLTDWSKETEYGFNIENSITNN